MPSFHRSHVHTLLARFAEPPRRIIAVFGPRQTGKTTLVREALRLATPPTFYVSADEVDPPNNLPGSERESIARLPGPPDTQWLVRAWERAREQAGRSTNGFVFALDEIQRIPRWSETVRGLWDADRAQDLPMHVIVLGSAPILVQSGLTESLAGRFELIRVAHWSFGEMAAAFDFDLPEYIYFGGYPGGAHLIRDESRWRDYILGGLVAPNIERDILAMTRVDKPALLKQLFELGTEYSGQILAYNKMLGQLHDAGNTTTLARYLDLLSTAGLLAGLPKYSRSMHRTRASSPKLNVLNTALMTAGSGYTFDQARADRTLWGRLVESAVGAHILNTAATNIRTYYWREQTLEVDFVLRQGPVTVAIEVKSGQPARRLLGLDAFIRRFAPDRTMIVGEGGKPLNEFLTTPVGEWFDEP